MTTPILLAQKALPCPDPPDPTEDQLLLHGTRLRPDVLPDLVEVWPDVENEKSIESEARPPGSDSHSGLFSVGHSELPQRDELRDLAR
ncbi:MAG: hypothetical protein ACRD0W_24225, partial [Acidimicrobiales bacterium]